MKAGEVGPRVYSYLRFSDPRQASGHSADRQLQYAQAWAAERGLTLDETLSLRDEGLSAYHQRHIKRGALGAFLAAVDEGRIASGSVLVVEGLDRLSRAEPIQAQAQLAQIINAGITVVTASDGREYSREVLKAQPMDLVYSLLVMIRAHEESDTKSKRVRAAIRRQCENWLAGTYRGIIRNGKDPRWVHWNGERFEIVPEYAAAIRRLCQLYMEGHGYVRIVRMLTDEGLKLSEKGAAVHNIYRIVRARNLIGEKVLKIDGEEFRLPGYYPALLTQEEFDRMQLVTAGRQPSPVRGEIPGVITGIGITRCGYCGTTMNGQNLVYRRREDGTMADGHRRLICVGYNQNTGCPVGGSCTVVPVERAVMRYCADQMNLTGLLTGDDRPKQLQAQLAARQGEVVALEKQLERVTEALMTDDGVAPLAFVRKARELEQQLSVATAGVNQLQRELVALSGHEAPQLSEEWAALIKGVDELDYDARIKARQLVADTFSKIVLYHRGIKPKKNARHIDLLLVAKSGQARMLTINRRTGEWQAGVVKG